MFRHYETPESLKTEDNCRSAIATAWEKDMEKIEEIEGYTPDWIMSVEGKLDGIGEFKDRSVGGYTIGVFPMNKTVNIDYEKFAKCLGVAQQQRVPFYLFFKFENGLFFSKHTDFSDVEEIANWGRTDRNDPYDMCKVAAGIRVKRFKLAVCPCGFGNSEGKDFCPNCDNVLIGQETEDMPLPPEWIR